MFFELFTGKCLLLYCISLSYKRLKLGRNINVENFHYIFCVYIFCFSLWWSVCISKELCFFYISYVFLQCLHKFRLVFSYRSLIFKTCKQFYKSCLMHLFSSSFCCLFSFLIYFLLPELGYFMSNTQLKCSDTGFSLNAVSSLVTVVTKSVWNNKNIRCQMHF